MTKEELLAANEQLGAEIAAHRTLLAAIGELATVPKPADWSDVEYICALEARLNTLRAYATPLNPDGALAGIVRVLHDRARILREDAAQPLRYAVKDTEPADGHVTYGPDGKASHHWPPAVPVVSVPGPHPDKSAFRAGYAPDETASVTA